MVQLERGGIYYIKFPQTFDANYKDGKEKFVLVLQEGEYFKSYNTVVVLQITKDRHAKGYETNVTIEYGTTKLDRESYIVCAQPYTILKSLFEDDKVWCAGVLDKTVMDDVDSALFNGLCMGQQEE